MTNGEKYKTANERAEAFRDWCKIEDGCLTCPLRNCTKGMQDCAFAWLDREADEDKPLPCPFCGNDDIKFSIVEDTSDGYMSCPQVFCKMCGATFELDWHRASDLGTTVTEEQKRQLLAKWNNRVEKK